MYHKYTLKGDLITSKQASNANRALDPAGVLALVLHWLSSKVEEKYLCLIFCVTAASINKYKNFWLKILLEMKSLKIARIVALCGQLERNRKDWQP